MKIPDFSQRARHSKAAAARHLKFGAPAGGFRHSILFSGVPRGVLILVSRFLFCARSCPFSPQKAIILEKSADQRILRINSNSCFFAFIHCVMCRRGFSGCFEPIREWENKMNSEDATTSEQLFNKKRAKIEKKRWRLRKT